IAPHPTTAIRRGTGGACVTWRSLLPLNRGVYAPIVGPALTGWVGQEPCSSPSAASPPQRDAPGTVPALVEPNGNRKRGPRDVRPCRDARSCRSQGRHSDPDPDGVEARAPGPRRL